MVRAYKNQCCVYAIDGLIQVFDIHILSIKGILTSHTTFAEYIPQIGRDHA